VFVGIDMVAVMRVHRQLLLLDVVGWVGAMLWLDCGYDSDHNAVGRNTWGEPAFTPSSPRERHKTPSTGGIYVG
jgi:hypothetical protein